MNYGTYKPVVKMQLQGCMYSYDQLTELLYCQMRQAAAEDPGSERARLASERYQRFVEHGMIPDEFSDDLGDVVTW